MTCRTRFSIYSILACASFACGGDDGASPTQPDAGADAAGDAAPEPLDRSKYSDVGLGAKLDYANPAYWVCRPDLERNECHADLDATEVQADGTLVPMPHVRAERPEIDCFYVYPTIWLDRTPQMTDFSDEGVKLVQDALLSQAARFNGVCEVYAPLYRQSGLIGAVPSAQSDPKIPLQDVRDAFQHYLAKYNHGRKFVLIGHSQGAMVLTELITQDIDGDEALRSKLLSAILLGAMPYTPPGEKIGGSFQNITACTEPGETGCIVAYNSFAKESPPTATSLFGMVVSGLTVNPVDVTGEVMCTDPAALAGHSGAYSETYFKLQLNSAALGPVADPPAGVTTPFVMYRELLQGECAAQNGHNYLSVSNMASGDDVRRPMYRTAILETLGFGMHVVDFNVSLGDLIALVRKQAKLD